LEFLSSSEIIQKEKKEEKNEWLFKVYWRRYCC
jgi:hypothetical protein